MAKRFLSLGRMNNGLPPGLTWKYAFFGVLFSFVVTVILIRYEFSTIPEYEIGDIADRTIVSPQEFTVEDKEATEAKKEEALSRTPAVFVFDSRVTYRVMREIRMAFADARQLIEEELSAAGVSPEKKLSTKQKGSIKLKLENLLPRFEFGRTIEICLQHRFSEELEDQIAQLLSESMKVPGVVLSRESLLRYQDRGLVLHDPVTGNRQPMEDWLAVRDLEQAKALLKQQEYLLTVVEGEDKKAIIDFLDTWVVPNAFIDEQATLENELRAKAEVNPVLIQVKLGKTIVRAGDEVTQQSVSQLSELRKLKMQERWFGRAVGMFFVIGFFFFVLWAYFHIAEAEPQTSRSDLTLIILVLVLGLAIVRVFLGFGDLITSSVSYLQDPLHLYFLAPFALGGILITLLLSVQMSILFSLAFAVFVGLMTNELTVSIYCLAGCLTAIYALKHYRERSALIRAGFIIGGVNLAIAMFLQLYSSEGAFQLIPLLVRCGAAFLGGVISAVLTSLFLPVLESLFQLTTDIRLLELSNLNSPILRRLSFEAPGTYHHSITVGTLAESGAESIGANTLLIRVGAYYHDIGKLKHPEYYVENQVFAVNKHELLSPTMSSLILASHVKDGLAIADEIGLGPRVSEMIPQHHGTRVMTFFYRKAKENAVAKNVEINEDDFRYPGPKPQTKEAAILMLADQVEAASRTLQAPTPGQVRSMIGRIVQATVQDGQFDECDVTMKELNEVGRAFERVLTGIHHHRIEYPGFNFNEQVKEAGDSSIQ